MLVHIMRLNSALFLLAATYFFPHLTDELSVFEKTLRKAEAELEDSSSVSFRDSRVLL